MSFAGGVGVAPGPIMMATPVSSAMRWMVRPTLEPLQMMSSDASFSMAHSWLS